MNTVIIGNLLALVGCLLMVSVGFITKKEKILTVQCFQMGIMGLGHLALGAVSGCIASMIGIARNLTFAKRESSVSLKIFFIVLNLVCSMGTLGNGLIEWLPIVAAGLFVWFLDTKSEVTLKTIIVVTQILWLIYDFSYSNYVSTTFDVLTILSNLIGIRMVKKQAQT